MATRHILGVDKGVVHELMEMRFFCHVAFNDDYLFNKAVELGFDKEAWEEKNNTNKVIIQEWKIKKH